MPRMRGPGRGMWERQLIDVSHINVSLPLLLPPIPLSKNKFKKSFKEVNKRKMCLGFDQAISPSEVDPMKIISPGWCGSVDGAWTCEPKGHQFDSQSGHMPGLQARSPGGGTREATTH